MARDDPPFVARIDLAKATGRSRPTFRRKASPLGSVPGAARPALRRGDLRLPILSRGPKMTADRGSTMSQTSEVSKTSEVCTKPTISDNESTKEDADLIIIERRS